MINYEFLRQFKTDGELCDFTEIIFGYRNTEYEEEKDSFAKSEGHWPFIASWGKDFVREMRELVELDGIKIKTFIDIGCGTGEKVFLAHYLFNLDSFGVEYTPQTFFVAEHLLRNLGGAAFSTKDEKKFNDAKRLDFINPHMYLLNYDAKKLDFSGFDLIFTYMPISKEESLWELYHVILSTMDIGSYWYEFMTSELQKFFSFRKIKFNETLDDRNRSPRIYQKVGKNEFKGIV